jgi:alanyl-tRNA synthetase
VWFGIKERVGATEFLGYDTETAEGVVCALAGGARSRSSGGRKRPRGVNQTPFYAESGGQVGDTGT